MDKFMGKDVPKLDHRGGLDNCQEIECDCSLCDCSSCLFDIKNELIKDKWVELVNSVPELLEALEALYKSFQHIEGNTKGNKAKTDIIMFNNDVKVAVNTARIIIDKTKGK